MKILPFFVLLFTGAITLAQGTLEFRAVLTGANARPANASRASASGEIILFADNLFHASIFQPIPTFEPIGAFIENDSQMFFPFEEPRFFAPLDGTGGAFNHRLVVTLNQNQINDLMNGNWYVNIRSDAFPNGEIRGQITLVPEPATVYLVALGLGILFVRKS